jgi:hypothetical protein
MPTNLAIDDGLMDEARKLGHHRTKKDTATAALDEYIQRRKQQGILSLFGTIEQDRAGMGILPRHGHGRNAGACCAHMRSGISMPICSVARVKVRSVR